MSRVSQLRRYFMQNTRQQLLLTLIDFWCVDILLHHKISLCQRDLECTTGKNQLGINKILHGCLLLQSGRNPCIMMTIFKSVECIVYRGTKSAVFNGNIFFLLESDTFIATQRLQSKLQFLLKTSLFYWQTVFKSTLFPHRHIFHATRQIQWKLQFMFSTKKSNQKTPKTLITDKQTLSFVA